MLTSMLAALISAIGVSLVLYNAVMVITKGQFKFMETNISPTAGLHFGYSGLLLGLLEAAGTQISFIGSAWKDVFSFGLLIVMLIFKPTGLLGVTEIERM